MAGALETILNLVLDLWILCDSVFNYPCNLINLIGWWALHKSSFIRSEFRRKHQKVKYPFEFSISIKYDNFMYLCLIFICCNQLPLATLYLIITRHHNVHQRHVNLNYTVRIGVHYYFDLLISSTNKKREQRNNNNKHDNHWLPTILWI